MLVVYYDNDNTIDRFQKVWNTETKAIESYVLSTEGDNEFNYLAGFVDAYQDGTVVIVRKGNYGGIEYLDQEILSGYILLEILNLSPTVKRIYLFNNSSKLLESREFAQSPPNNSEDLHLSVLNNNYVVSNTLVLSSTCEGTTKKEVYYEGNELSIILYESSVDCGFIAPESGINVFEAKVIKIDHTCHQNPVLLKWSNSLGGWDQFMFKYNQQIDINTLESAVIKNYVPDISTTKSNSYQLGKRTTKSMILGADGLSENDFNGIVPDLLTSPYVCIVYPLASGISDLRVSVSPGTFSMSTKNKTHSIEFEINFPEPFIVRN